MKEKDFYSRLEEINIDYHVDKIYLNLLKKLSIFFKENPVYNRKELIEFMLGDINKKITQYDFSTILVIMGILKEYDDNNEDFIKTVAIITLMPDSEFLKMTNRLLKKDKGDKEK